MKSKSRKGLGRGIEALFSENNETNIINNKSESIQIVSIDLVEPNPYQPRTIFEDDALNDLTKSIKDRGVLQPILVRKSDNKQVNWQIIAGERRWRAAQKAGLHEIPILIQDIKDSDIGIIALIENMQREDLSPLEEAEGFKKLIDDFGLTQESLAKSIGCSRTHVTNTLRLLTLPEEIRNMLANKLLNAGHVRPLLGQENIVELAKLVISKKLNVRQVEELVRKDQKHPNINKHKDPNILALIKELEDILGLKIKISDKKGKGSITFKYDNLDQLDEIVKRIKKNN